MPREKKTAKRPRTTSTDSDRESTDSSRGSTASQPQSPTKKPKRTNSKKGSGRDPSGVLDVPPPGGDNIIISNPFEDNPTAAPSLRSLNTFSRQLNQQMMNCHFNPYQNSFHTNMPPSGYNNSMYNNHSNSSNGPVQPMMYNSQGGPMFPCGTCHKEIGDADAIHCRSYCNFWFHRTCVGLVESAYRLLTTEPLAEWVCDKCVREKKIPLVRVRTQQIAS